MCCRIEPIDLVKDDCFGLQRAEAVGESDRNEQLFVTLAVQFDGNVPSKARGRTTHINGDIKNASSQHANQLRLGERRPLIMQAANRSRAIGFRLVVLKEIAAKALRG